MKRRDITLGEMQDECKRKKKCQECDYKEVCPARSGNEEIPERWNLTDTPRFTERQMALLKALYDNGVWRLKTDACITSMYKFNYDYIGNFINTLMGIKIEDGETLDLAELLGKDGAE